MARLKKKRKLRCFGHYKYDDWCLHFEANEECLDQAECLQKTKQSEETQIKEEEKEHDSFVFAYSKHGEISHRGPCPSCGKRQIYKQGKTKLGIQWYRCKACKHYFKRKALNPPSKETIEKQIAQSSHQGSSVQLHTEDNPLLEMQQNETLLEMQQMEEEWLEHGQFEDHRPEGLKRWMHEHGRR